MICPILSGSTKVTYCGFETLNQKAYKMRLIMFQTTLIIQKTESSGRWHMFKGAKFIPKQFSIIQMLLEYIKHKCEGLNVTYLNYSFQSYFQYFFYSLVSKTM